MDGRVLPALTKIGAGTAEASASVEGALQIALHVSLSKDQVQDVVGFVGRVLSVAQMMGKAQSAEARVEVAVKTGKDCADNVIALVWHRVREGVQDAAEMTSTALDVEKTLVQSLLVDAEGLKGDRSASVTMQVAPPQLPRAPGFNAVVYTANGGSIRLAALTLFKDAGFRGMTWTSWTAERATDSGAGSYNTCTPSCAEANYAERPAQLRLDHPVRTCGHVHFARITLTEGTTTSIPDHPGTPCTASG